MKYPKIVACIALALILTGCVGAVVGVAVDTTVAVVKAPFQIAGAVIGVTADTTGTVIGAPFRMAGAAIGAGRHDHHEDHHAQHSTRHQDYGHDGEPSDERYQH